MEEAGRAEFVRLFYVLDLVGLGAVGGGILIGLGQWPAAAGLGIGVAIYIAKSYFLYETGRALIKQRDRRRVGLIAGAAGLGRLAFVAVTIAVIAQASIVTALAAGVALILCQAYFHLIHLRHTGGTRCPEE